MIVLGFDTATHATTVAVRMADGSTLATRDDPSSEAHPGHATRLLAMASELLARAGLGWGALERIAVGLGPGRFTGLRVGVATARGLAQSLEVGLVGVSSLRALAGVALDARKETSINVLAVIDARRGEAFAAAYSATRELISARVLVPDELSALPAQAGEGAETAQVGEGAEPAQAGEGAESQRWLAVGDGAVRFRAQLQQAGVVVPADSSSLHEVGAEAICDLGVRAPAVAYETVVPCYLRRPDAEIALEDAQNDGGR